MTSLSHPALVDFPSDGRTPLRVVIGAGGTGGHIYPGLAVADAIRVLRPDAVVTFSGTLRGLETRLVPEAGYQLDTFPMMPFSRASAMSLLRLPFHVARSVRQAAHVLRRESVDVVIGMGGYPSIPVVLASRLTGVPCLVHESNAVPGLANALAARVTRNVAVGFETDSGSWRPGRKARVTGVPVSSSIVSGGGSSARREARKHFGVGEEEQFVIVSGGSLGAASLNRAAADLASTWSGRHGVRLLVKARPDDEDRLRAELAATGGDRIADVVTYIDRMDLAYAAADAVVMRAGSGTIAELQFLGTRAVLVPYPFAPGDHQTHNARVLERIGQAVVVADSDLDVATLAIALLDVLGRPSPAIRSSESRASSHHATAAQELAQWAIDLASARKGRI